MVSPRIIKKHFLEQKLKEKGYVLRKMMKNFKGKPGSGISHRLFLQRMAAGDPLPTNTGIFHLLRSASWSAAGASPPRPHGLITGTPSSASEQEFVWNPPACPLLSFLQFKLH